MKSNISKSKNTRENYFSDFIKRGYLIYALLIASITFTLAVMADRFYFYAVLRATNNLLLFVTVALSLLAETVLIHFFVRIKSGEPDLSDPLALAIVIASAAILLHAIFMANKIRVSVIIISAVMLVAGIVFFCIFTRRYTVKNKRDIVYSKNSFSSYFFTVIKKYNFYSVVILGVLLACFFYMFGDPLRFHGLITIIENDAMLKALFYSALGATLLWLASSVTSKKTGFIDCVLFSLAISLPIMIIQIGLLSGFTKIRFLICACVVAGYLFLVAIRLISYDVTRDWQAKNCQNYFSEYGNKFNFFLPLAVACICLFILAFAVRSKIYFALISKTDGVISDVSINLLPFTALTVFAATALTAAVPCSVINLKQKRVTLMDVSIQMGLYASLTAFVTGIIFGGHTATIIASALALCEFVALICIRIKTTDKQKR